MKLETVYKRMKISPLPNEAIRELYIKMRGFKDEDTTASGKYNHVWVKAVKEVHEKYLKNGR